MATNMTFAISLFSKIRSRSFFVKRPTLIDGHFTRLTFHVKLFDLHLQKLDQTSMVICHAIYFFFLIESQFIFRLFSVTQLLFHQNDHCQSF